MEENSSAQAEEIERIKQRATVSKNALEHSLSDIKSEINETEKQIAELTSDRMKRLMLERKLGELKTSLLRKEESIYFDAMRIDLSCEESIKKFIDDERINARLQRHFEIEIIGG